jgi:iron-sulfur cluster assembly protein
MFNLSTAAAQQVIAAAETSDAAGMALRIAARVDADGSIQYGMGFDEPNDADMKLMLHDVSVLIGAESQELLDATVMDYVELKPGEFNFIFIDERAGGMSPQAAAKGGCGGGSCSSGGCGGGRSC